MLGHVVGKYKIQSPIGEGGMGMVYRAEHVVLASPAAVKVLLPQFTQDPVVVERFFQEARAASAIRSPGVVEVFDYGRLPNGQAYIAMELLRGEDLASFLERHKVLAPSLAVHIAAEMFAALNATHLIGVVHRDLKPDNIYLVRDAGSPGGVRVKILDFGIAKLVGDGMGLGANTPRPKSKGGSILGTPTYMAPEQCRGGVALDARVDLYATGCILFEMLTGRPPFLSAGSGEIMAMHMFEPPPRLSNLAPHLPVELDALLAKLLTKAPEDRIPSAAYALAALERASLPPLVGEVPLAGAQLMTGALSVPSATGAVELAASRADDRDGARWLPLGLIAGAVLIAVAIAVVIGVT
ncbi:MAG TPA: serine/threonine-protein kinase [Kofleriaceae bacterium]|nr:serine/threonine-protein kinase [Kofleriaceae bacterium]